MSEWQTESQEGEDEMGGESQEGAAMGDETAEPGEMGGGEEIGGQEAGEVSDY